MVWTRYRFAEEAWAAMLRDIRGATKSIDCESYILKAEGIGDEFIGAFRAKAEQGVKIRLLCDGVGSYGLMGSKTADDLRSVGVELKFFNPIKAWRIPTIMSWFFRNHRKILIIDETIGYTGGVGLQEGMRGWRDTQIRVEGEIVKSMQQAFINFWNGMEHERHPFVSSPATIGGEFNFLESAPISKRRGKIRQNFIYRNLIDTITHAKSYIYLTTPYLIPPIKLLSTLRAAARRKVDVRILVPWNSDHTVVDHAVHSYFGLLLRAGVRVFAYTKNVVHAKTGVSDETWASVGSCNLDNLSLFFNYEGNIITSNQEVIQTLKQDFLEDCEHANEITREAWKDRPLHMKLKEGLTWPLHGFF